MNLTGTTDWRDVGRVADGQRHSKRGECRRCGKKDTRLVRPEWILGGGPLAYMCVPCRNEEEQE